jgi:hypothetical protein
MKRILIICSIAAITFVACKNNTTPPATTAGAAMQNAVAQPYGQPYTTQPVYQQPVYQQPVYQQRVRVVHQPVVTRETRYVSTNSAPARRRGMSSGAKDALIGGAGGAVVGAVVSKNNRGSGALIGGVIGATGGYLLGHSKDKRTGRVPRRY